MKKKDEAKEILNALGTPAKQQNTMCCYVLLAMAGLRECPAYTLLYQFSPKDTGQSKVK